MMATSERSHSGGGLWVLAAIGLIIAAFVLAGNSRLDVVPRADGHVEAKHGTAARDILRSPGPRDYHYSAVRETVMVSRCDTTTCALMYIGARGLGIQPGTFRPEILNGRLELTSHFCSLARREAIIRRDGYIYLGTW